MSVSFPLWGAVCYFGMLENSLKFLSWLENAHIFPHVASADLNLCPSVIVAVSCCCCSSAYSYPVEGRVLLSAGGVPGLEPVCIILAALIVPVIGIWCLAQVCERAAGEERWHWKCHRISPHNFFERRCNLWLEKHCWHQTAAGSAPHPAPAGGERVIAHIHIQNWAALVSALRVECVFVCMCMYVSWDIHGHVCIYGSSTSQLLFRSYIHFYLWFEAFHSAETRVLQTHWEPFLMKLFQNLPIPAIDNICDWNLCMWVRSLNSVLEWSIRDYIWSCLSFSSAYTFICGLVSLLPLSVNPALCVKRMPVLTALFLLLGSVPSSFLGFRDTSCSIC